MRFSHKLWLLEDFIHHGNETYNLKISPDLVTFRPQVSHVC